MKLRDIKTQDGGWLKLNPDQVIQVEPYRGAVRIITTAGTELVVDGTMGLVEMMLDGTYEFPPGLVEPEPEPDEAAEAGDA